MTLTKRAFKRVGTVWDGIAKTSHKLGWNVDDIALPRRNFNDVAPNRMNFKRYGNYYDGIQTQSPQPPRIIDDIAQIRKSI